MRALGVLLAIVLACTLFLGAPAFAQAQRPDDAKQKVTSKDPGTKPLWLLQHNKPKARSSFPKHKKGEKSAGFCSIDCGDGSGGITWARDVQDCACQCADLCSSDCFAWEVYGPGTAYC